MDQLFAKKYQYKLKKEFAKKYTYKLNKAFHHTLKCCAQLHEKALMSD